MTFSACPARLPEGIGIGPGEQSCEKQGHNLRSRNQEHQREREKDFCQHV